MAQGRESTRQRKGAQPFDAASSSEQIRCAARIRRGDAGHLEFVTRAEERRSRGARRSIRHHGARTPAGSGGAPPGHRRVVEDRSSSDSLELRPGWTARRRSSADQALHRRRAARSHPGHVEVAEPVESVPPPTDEKVSHQRREHLDESPRRPSAEAIGPEPSLEGGVRRQAGRRARVPRTPPRTQLPLFSPARSRPARRPIGRFRFQRGGGHRDAGGLEAASAGGAVDGSTKDQYPPGTVSRGETSPRSSE